MGERTSTKEVVYPISISSSLKVETFIVTMNIFTIRKFSGEWALCYYSYILRFTDTTTMHSRATFNKTKYTRVLKMQSKDHPAPPPRLSHPNSLQHTFVRTYFSQH